MTSLTRAQRDALVKAIKKVDALGAGEYYADGLPCALGCLGFQRDGSFSDDLRLDELLRLGLTNPARDEVISENDRGEIHEDPHDRRNRMLAWLRGLECEA